MQPVTVSRVVRGSPLSALYALSEEWKLLMFRPLVGDGLSISCVRVCAHAIWLCFRSYWECFLREGGWVPLVARGRQRRVQGGSRGCWRAERVGVLKRFHVGAYAV